jgi:hypothetical protein
LFVLAAIGGLAFVLGSLVVGGRLLLLARRTVASLCALVTTSIGLVLQAAGTERTLSVTGLFVGPLGVLSAAGMWLAFIPPQRYLDWVLARAGTEAT